jgi:hypothetical protein
LDAAEFLRSRNWHRLSDEVECSVCGVTHGALPSGLDATIRLPRIRDCIMAGEVPLAVVSRLGALAEAASQGEQVDIDPDDSKHVARFQDEVVTRMVTQIQGEDVVMSTAAAAEMAEEDFDLLAAIGIRSKPLPKVETS